MSRVFSSSFSSVTPAVQNINNQKQKNKKTFVKKSLALVGIIGGVVASDLFLARGKAINSLTKGKISFVKNMSDDINNILAKDSYATKTRLEAFLSTPGLHALWGHRVAHRLYEANVPVLPRFLSNITRFFTGIEIHPGAQIGKNLFLDHTGAIIGQTAKIGDDVTMVGRVVLGSTGKGNDFLRHTIVEDGVTIGMNSTMLGRITIGKNSKIGAGALVCHDVPKNVTVIGNPAKIITLNNKRLDVALPLTKNSVSEMQKIEI